MTAFALDRSLRRDGAGRAITLGLVAGAAVSAHEWIELYAAHLSLGDSPAVAARIFVHSGIQYVALSLVLLWMGRRGPLSWSGALACWLGFGLVSEVGLGVHNHLQPLMLGDGQVIGDPGGRVAWIALFYGGMFVIAWKAHAKWLRTSQVLADAELARRQTEALLEREQMKALQGRIDPALLLQAMREVRRRHGSDPAGGARVLDALVAFLRAAMPAVRSGDSTLVAELRAARRYAALLAELDPARPRWTFSVDGALPALRFPALWLMPAMDRLASAPRTPAAGEGSLRVGVVASAGRLTLDLDGGRAARADWIEPELVHRMKVGLRAAFGSAWALALDPRPGSLVLSLDLPLIAATPTPALSVEALFDTPGERR